MENIIEKSIALGTSNIVLPENLDMNIPLYQNIEKEGITL